MRGKHGQLAVTFSESKNRTLFSTLFLVIFSKLHFFCFARNSRTIPMYFFAISVTTSGLPSAIAFTATRSEPTPSANAPASRNSAAVPSITPPVGIISTCGSGPLSAVRYFAPPIALAGNTFTTSAPACQAVTISVGVNAPGSTATCQAKPRSWPAGHHGDYRGN